MPFISVDMWSGRPKETREKLIENLTKACCETLNCPPEAVIVALHEVPKENWGHGGKAGQA